MAAENIDPELAPEPDVDADVTALLREIAPQATDPDYGLTAFVPEPEATPVASAPAAEPPAVVQPAPDPAIASERFAFAQARREAAAADERTRIAYESLNYILAGQEQLRQQLVSMAPPVQQPKTPAEELLESLDPAAVALLQSQQDVTVRRVDERLKPVVEAIQQQRAETQFQTVQQQAVAAQQAWVRQQQADEAAYAQTNPTYYQDLQAWEQQGLAYWQSFADRGYPVDPQQKIADAKRGFFVAAQREGIPAHVLAHEMARTIARQAQAPATAPAAAVAPPAQARPSQAIQQAMAATPVLGKASATSGAQPTPAEALVEQIQAGRLDLGMLERAAAAGKSTNYLVALGNAIDRIEAGG